MFSTCLKPLIWLSLNCCRVCAFAFGKDDIASVSAFVFASVTPSRIFTNVKRLSGCCQCAHWQQPLNLFTFVKMRDGVTDANTKALTDAMSSFPNAKAQTRQQFKDNQINGFKQVLNILYVLLALSVVVSLFGIVNTLVLTVF